MVAYLDTSALLQHHVEEKGSELVREAVGTAELTATSAVAYAEARAGLVRRWREDDFTDAAYRGAVEGLDADGITRARLHVSNALARSAGEPAERHAVRGFDNAHLANALRPFDRF